MPWSGGYYYRSVRVNGRPRRQYVGGGLIGQLAAQMDAAEREQRKAEKDWAAEARAEAEWTDDDLRAVERLADALARAALVAAGCHRHHRGEWRRRRERPEG
jgi:hypothetical protein